MFRLPRRLIQLFVVSAFLGSALLAAPVPSHAQVPGCLTGEWRAVDLEQTFRNLFGPDTGFQIQSITGGISMTLQPDGTYESRYEQYHMIADAFGSPMEMSMDGALRGTYRESSPGYLASSVTSSDTIATTVIGGNRTSAPLDLRSDEVNDAMQFDCAAGRLTFTIPGETPFRLSFVRR